MRTAAAVVAVLAFAAGCGGDSEGGANGDQQPPAASGGTSAPVQAAQHNDADIEFAQGMIPHHQQAVEMAGLAATRAANPQLKELAATIAAAQAPEITQLTGFLSAWGAPPPSSSGGHGAHESMPGMMSDADLASLEKASGRGFDKMFLEMMIEHHEGALKMATAEQQRGQHPEAKALAKKIETDQSAEIVRMKTMLQSV